MPIVRQLTELYLRGALANVTMKDLTPDDTAEVMDVIEKVVDHPSMQKHRYQVTKVWGETIGGDYKENRAAGEQEYYITIWKAAVNLLFHKYYRFECESCGASKRKTKTTGKLVNIDRRFVPCPCCGMAKRDDEIVKFVEGADGGFSSCIAALSDNHYDLEEAWEQYMAGEISLKVFGRRVEQFRYDDPDRVLDDPVQLSKFFGEFVWGYFNQVIRENKRVEHLNKPQKVTGRADEIVVESIISCCKKSKVKYNFCKDSQPEDGWWNISLLTNEVPPEFIYELLPFFRTAEEHGVDFCVSGSGIAIRECRGSDLISAFVVMPEHVMMVDDSGSIDDSEDGGSIIQQVSFKTSGGNRMDQENHVEYIDNRELIESVYNSLPNGDCKVIFNLFCQQGDDYDRYCRAYGDRKPNQTHMAKFLDITPNTVKSHISTIRNTCLAQNFVPG